MRAFALVSILALTLAACGEKPAGPAKAAEAAQEGSSLTFDAAGLPTFKPGLWDVTQRDSDGEVEHTQQCMGAEATQEVRDFVTRETEGCTKQVNRSGGALVVSGVCTQADVRTDMRVALKGSDTRSEMSIRMTVQNLRTKEAPTTMEMTATGRWVGACPAGVEPGEEVGGEG